MTLDSTVIQSQDREILTLSKPDLKEAKIINENQKNIDRFVMSATVEPGTSGTIFRWVGPVSIGPMEELTGFERYSTFRVVSMAYAPSKFGGMMSLTEEAEHQTQGNLMGICSRLLTASAARLREQLASDVLGGFTETVGNYQHAINYEDVTNALIDMSEGYDERWIFGEPSEFNAVGIMTRSALKEMRLASVGGAGVTGSNVMWGGDPLPAGRANEIYTSLFSMSDPSEGVSFYRGPRITTFPVDKDTGAIQTSLTGGGGGMNGALFHPDGIFMSTKGADMTMRTVPAVFNTVDIMQIWFYRAYAIGLNERGVTLKSKTRAPKARTIS